MSVLAHLAILTCLVLGLAIPLGSGWPVDEAADGPDAIDLASLVAELTDLHQLARWPEPAYQLRHFVVRPVQAGGDRPDAAGAPDGGPWVAVEGPGVLVRLWSPNPSGAGRVRIRVDGVEVVAAPLIDLLAGSWDQEGTARVPPPLAEMRGGTGVCLLPVPFGQRLEIRAERMGFVGHATVRVYPPSTDVVPFRIDQLRQHQSRIAEVARSLALRQPADLVPRQRMRQTGDFRLAPGERQVLCAHVGAAAVELMRLSFTGRAAPLELRSLVLVGRFDEPAEPQLVCPVLDFFGAGLQGEPRSTLTTRWQANHSGLSTWVMPWERVGELALVNLGERPVEGRWEVVLLRQPWSPRLLHFHARWQRHWPVPPRPAQPLNLISIQGAGVIVGQSLHVLNPTPHWWGDGRERMGTLAPNGPSWEGTGLGDYFGMGLDPGREHDGAVAGHRRDAATGHQGWNYLDRLLLLDRVPFTAGLHFETDVAPWEAEGLLAFEQLCVWYGRPGGTHRFPVLRASELRFLPALQKPRQGDPP
ncbi:MAG TPA: DUF2961 domain-containing protein [Gemmatales bacterium]|nr:DUF2961 domain-containing protein [Gemmatales bacterium]